MQKNINEIKKIIGDLEMMAAAAEPGLVLTEEMTLTAAATLLAAAGLLKKKVGRGSE